MAVELKNLERDEFIEKEAEYGRKFRQLKNWRNIPILNYTPIYTVKHGSLVRFRGVIKDMLDDETYLEQYEVTNLLTNEKRIQIGKYQDTLNLKPNETVDMTDPANVYKDRKLLYMVSMPCLNSWASEFESKINNDISNFSKGGADNFNRMNKRTFGNEFSKPVNTTTTELANSKRMCASTSGLQNVSSGAGTSQSSFNFVSALNAKPNPACIVKLYSEYKTFLLNASIEVLGFISIQETLQNAVIRVNPNDPIDEINEPERTRHPPYQGPLMHIIAIRKLNNLNPMLDIGLLEIDTSFTNGVESVFKNLLFTLTQCLFGDKLAAKYLIGHLISTIYVRTETQTLGQYSINIFNIPNNENLAGYTESLYEILELVLPATHYLPMSLENMNTTSFVPKKDYRTSKFETGVLQLADHSQLVLDETKLKSGKLEINGIQGLKILGDLIQKQQIYYDFEYYKIGLQTNIPVLVLSKRRSTLPSNCLVPLKYDADTIPVIMETLKAAKYFIQPKLEEMRKYLTRGKLIEFYISVDVSRMIERDFVEMRNSSNGFGSEYLHNLLVLSRLMGIATGKKKLDKESWQMAKDMERERRLRLEAI